MANTDHLWEESDKIMTCIQETYHDWPCFAPSLHGHHLSGRGLRSESFSFLVIVAVPVWAEIPVTVAVAGLVKGEGHAFERRNKVFSKHETNQLWDTKFFDNIQHKLLQESMKVDLVRLPLRIGF